jgi:hypothetical protein
MGKVWEGLSREQTPAGPGNSITGVAFGRWGAFEAVAPTRVELFSDFTIAQKYKRLQLGTRAAGLGGVGAVWGRVNTVG